MQCLYCCLVNNKHSFNSFSVKECVKLKLLSAILQLASHKTLRKLWNIFDPASGFSVSLKLGFQNRTSPLFLPQMASIMLAVISKLFSMDMEIKGHV